MKVSIITITYNSAETVEDTIKSVLSQDYQNIEYIIIDGASRDNTLSIISHYKNKVSILVSEPDKGIYDAMNKGLSLAKGDIIGLLNSDDVYAHASVISNMVDKLKEKEADAVYGDLVYVDRKMEKVIRYWKAGEYTKGLFLKGWMPPHPTFFVKKYVYDKLGLFNLQLKSSADYELMLRFIHKGNIIVVYLPEVMVKMRTGGQSNVTLRNRIKANQEDRLAWKLNGLSPTPFTLILKPLMKARQFFLKK
ncbi:MAG: glycosyltransferase [Bacteroidetes bacterium]|nr:glycosyltransferase [Bacteroidota bacterium]